MPHIIVEHSANLTASHELDELAQIISDAAMETGIFPLAGVRVRMHPSETYSIADGHKDNAYVAVIMRIGAGRDLDTRQNAGKAVFDRICQFFEDDIAAGFMAISLDIEINDPEMSFKMNGIRDRLKRDAQ